MYIALISHVSKIKWSEVAQACPILCDPMDCSLPGSSVHRIFQARVLAWVVISFSRHASKVMLKFLQAIVQHYVNWELLDVQAGFRKVRGMREQHSLDHRKSKGISEKKKSTSASLTRLKHLIVRITTNWKILKEMGILDHITCLLRSLYVSQEATVRTLHETMNWFKNRKGAQGSIL